MILRVKQIENAQNVIEGVKYDQNPLPSKATPGPPGGEGRICQWANGVLDPGSEDQMLVEGEHENHRGDDRRTEAENPDGAFGERHVWVGKIG